MMNLMLNLQMEKKYESRGYRKGVWEMKPKCNMDCDNCNLEVDCSDW